MNDPLPAGGQNDLPDIDALRAHMGSVSPLAARKTMPALERHSRAFIALSPFLVMASSDADGRADASPRGDPPGFVQVLSDTLLLLPDRPGNNLVDTFTNILSAPGIGLIFFVPGIEETLRVNGRGRILTDAARLEPSIVAGKVPKTGLLIDVEEVFFHCAKAIRRARLWDPDTRVDRSVFPSLGRIIADQNASYTEEEAERRLTIAYRERMY